jgi:hypothetical protein
MTTTTHIGAHREPRIAIGVVLDTGPALIADIAVALDVLTAIVTDQPESEIGLLQVDHAHVRPVWALVVLEHDGARPIVSSGDDGAVRSWRADGTPGPLQVDRSPRWACVRAGGAEH